MSELLNQNWEKFLNIQAVGDWNGIWTRVEPGGKVLEHFHGVRSYVVYPDGEAAIQKNHYCYENGTSESKTFGPYRKGEVKTPFLDYSWTWGYTSKIEPGQLYIFETCIKHERLGVSGACKYMEDGSLHHVTSIWEQCDFFQGEPQGIEYPKSGNWKVAIASIITPELIANSSIDCQWKPIDELTKDNLIVRFSNGLTVSLPETAAYNQESLIITEWLVNPRLLKRGIRHYNNQGKFCHFSLMTFTLEKD
jgi:Domain of unknown function (DUF3598)